MGLNVNLVEMLGLPTDVVCPHCGVLIPTHFDDFDIECYVPKKGVIKFESHECSNCEKPFSVKCKVELTSTKIKKG